MRVATTMIAPNSFSHGTYDHGEWPCCELNNALPAVHNIHVCWLSCLRTVMRPFNFERGQQLSILSCCLLTHSSAVCTHCTRDFESDFFSYQIQLLLRFLVHITRSWGVQFQNTCAGLCMTMTNCDSLALSGQPRAAYHTFQKVSAVELGVTAKKPPI